MAVVIVTEVAGAAAAGVEGEMSPPAAPAVAGPAAVVEQRVTSMPMAV